MSPSLKEKKQVTKDWLFEFPELSAYSPDKLYKIVGPFILGLRLMKLPGVDEYRPHFFCFPLWRQNVKDCLEETLILREILNNRGFQFDIPYAKHAESFAEAVACVRKQSIVPLVGDMPLGLLFDLIQGEFGRTLIRSSPVGQAKLFEAKLAAILYSGNQKLAESALRQIQKTGETWRPEFFNWKYGSFNKWLQGLDEMVNHVDSFVTQVRLNRQDQKLKGLIISEVKK